MRATDRLSLQIDRLDSMKCLAFSAANQNHIKHTSNPLCIRTSKKMRGKTAVDFHCIRIRPLWPVYGLDYYSLEFLWACHSLAHSIAPPSRVWDFSMHVQHRRHLARTPFDSLIHTGAFRETCMGRWAAAEAQYGKSVSVRN